MCSADSVDDRSGSGSPASVGVENANGDAGGPSSTRGSAPSGHPGDARDTRDTRLAARERSEHVERTDNGEETDNRVRAAWRTWLSALGTDAEAAAAAALAYESLPEEGRLAWLDAVDADAPAIDVPRIALYAPLLAIEQNPILRARIEKAVLLDAPIPVLNEATAVRAKLADGYHAVIFTMPLYLHFVQVLGCIYEPDIGVRFARHDPLRHAADPFEPPELAGLVFMPVPIAEVVEDLAHAIVADRRKGKTVPSALKRTAHLFGTAPR